MKIELKPCPLCGGEAQAEIIQWGEVVNASIHCYRCGVGIHRNDQNGALDAAVAAWNTRHERTCEDMETDPNWFSCSKCGCTCNVDYWSDGLGNPNYCPRCGAKVLEPSSNLLGGEGR